MVARNIQLGGGLRSALFSGVCIAVARNALSTMVVMGMSERVTDSVQTHVTKRLGLGQLSTSVCVFYVVGV